MPAGIGDYESFIFTALLNDYASAVNCIPGEAHARNLVEHYAHSLFYGLSNALFLLKHILYIKKLYLFSIIK